jgi:hypothetical protein
MSQAVQQQCFLSLGWTAAACLVDEMLVMHGFLHVE